MSGQLDNDIRRRAQKTAPQALAGYVTWELLFAIVQAIIPAVNNWVEHDGTWQGLKLIAPAIGTAVFASVFSYIQNKYRTSKDIEL